MALNFFKINKGVGLSPQTAEPTGANGDIYYNSTTNKFRAYQNGAWTDAISGGSGTGLTWSEVTGTSQTMVVNNAYVANNASIISFTLPSTSAVGDVVAIVGKGAGGWQVSGSGKTIYDLTTPYSSLASVGANDCIELVCITANSVWEIRNKNVAGIASMAKTKAYIAGGQDAATEYNRVDRFTFSSETITLLNVVTNALNYVCLDAQRNANSSSKGYVISGRKTAALTPTVDIQDFSFTSETSATLAATLSIGKSGTAGFSSAIKAYVAGGRNSGTFYNTVSALTFSGETTANLAAVLSENKNRCGAVFTASKAYVQGGNINGVYSNKYEGFTYSTEAMATLAATLGSARMDGASVMSTTKGYFLGGFNGGFLTAISALTFATETDSTLSATIATGTFGGANGSSSTRGYLFGGDTGSATDAIRYINFSGETTSSLGAILSAGRFNAMSWSA